jgi:hypothetical protein
MHSPSDPAPGLASALGQAASATVPPRQLTPLRLLSARGVFAQRG